MRIERPRLLVLNPTCLDVVEQHRSWIEREGVELWAEQSNRDLNEAAAIDLAERADGLVLPAAVRDFPRAVHMARCPRLLVCAVAASGFEWLDVTAATSAGIVVTYAPGGEGAEVVADLAWGLMLAVARQIPDHHQRLQNGDARRGMGSSLFGKTLGIVGLGSIGRATARRGRGFDMRVLAATPNPDHAYARAEGIEIVPLDELLARADFVSLHVRLTPQTRAMIGARELARMKSGAYLINTARKELVDQAALAAAIGEGAIAGAGLDDPPGPELLPLLRNPNLVVTPHIGNRAIEGVNAVFRSAVESALCVFRGQRPPSIVNPEVYQRGLRPNAWATAAAMQKVER